MTTKQLESPLFDQLQSKFELQQLQHQAGGNTARNEAMESFKTLGFPSIKNEEWRFTNILPLVKENYEVVNTVSEADVTKAASIIAAAPQQNLWSDAYTIVLVNGIFVPSLSTLPAEAGCTFVNTANAGGNTAFEQHFGTLLNTKQNAFAALNSAMYQDGFFVHLAANVVLSKKVVILKVVTTAQNLLIQTRDLIVLEKSAALEVVEHYLVESEHSVLWNNATEVVLAQNAQCDHYDLQKAPASLRIIQRKEVAQSKHANYSNYTFTLPGASFVRNNLALHLNDEEIESHLYGLYLTADQQVVDNHTEVHHKMPKGESNQLYKGIIMDKSKAVFNGKIFVYEDAQKTNAFQQSNNVLFSETATVHAKPQLEIFADDVKCSHGTTIGQLNKEALFYLKSRGIGETQARQLMVKAFAFDVAEKIKDEALKDYVEALISEEMEAR